MRNRFYAAVVLVVISMVALGLDDPRLAAQGRGPSFTLGFRGDDVVINGSSLPQVQQVICTLTTAGLEVDEPGAQGWSFGVQPRGACWIADYSTIGMASGTVAQRGMVQAAGFERTDILDDGAGIRLSLGAARDAAAFGGDAELAQPISEEATDELLALGVAVGGVDKGDT